MEDDNLEMTTGDGKLRWSLLGGDKPQNTAFGQWILSPPF